MTLSKNKTMRKLSPMKATTNFMQQNINTISDYVEKLKKKRERAETGRNISKEFLPSDKITIDQYEEIINGKQTLPKTVALVEIKELYTKQMKALRKEMLLDV